jgi:hypothetical protein
MFRACYCPSSGGLTIYIQQLIRVRFSGLSVAGSDGNSFHTDPATESQNEHVPIAVYIQ